MIDLAGGMEARNGCIRHRTHGRSFAEMLMATLTLLTIAGAVLFYLWVRFRVTEIGYETQELRKTEAALERTRAALVLEEETLKHPQRIEHIARNELGMFPVQPGQLLPAGVSDLEAVAPTSLAMAGIPYKGGTPRRNIPAN